MAQSPSLNQCPTVIYPSPGEYSDPVSVRLENQKASRIFFSFEDIDISWIQRAIAPDPIRSHAGFSDHLIGGSANNQSLSFNHFYDKKTDSWHADTELPISIKNPGTTHNLVSCGLFKNKINTTLSWNENEKSWKSKCPSPKAIDEHNLVKTTNFYLLNGNEDILCYNETTDSWSTVAKNDYARSYASATTDNENIYFTAKNHIMTFDTTTSTMSYLMPYSSLVGSSIICEHDKHFLIVGGHGHGISNQVQRIDMIKRSTLTQPNAPQVGAYMAGSNHSTIAGLSRDNAHYQFTCPFTWEQYIKPVVIKKQGKIDIFAIAIDDKMKIIDHQKFEFNIMMKSVFLKINLSSDACTIIRWPGYLKIDGSDFYVKDLLYKNISLDVSDNDSVFKTYNLDLIERYPSLNMKLIRNHIYKLKINNSEQKYNLTLEAHATL